MAAGAFDIVLLLLMDVTRLGALSFICKILFSADALFYSHFCQLRG